MIRALALAVALACPGTALAQAGLDALDRRSELLGWEAVGRLDMPHGTCTATLIAADVVLTAAHCLHGLDADAPVRFRAGLSHGRAVSERQLAGWVMPERYRTDRGALERTESVGLDVALGRLDAPISTTDADPFLVLTDEARGDALSVVSYGRGRLDAPSRQGTCRIRQRFTHEVLGFDCDVTFGSSGAPVFARQGRRMRILSVVSAGDGVRAFGPRVAGRIAPLQAALDRDVPAPASTTGIKRLRVGEGRAGASGARFVRPERSP
ncbi:Trypsin [Roseivivax jejudonensis]|uniref:Serine protease n=1 Tax=Roseivivax jejudonensis TaxID=1529041 RepID=A0A1X6YL27_9RHOB|nr:trypsin-like serine protease [Roseivivax jejudonensis]SLN23930.1 Trypsin [Roseivivax jejudonensis]